MKFSRRNLGCWGGTAARVLMHQNFHLYPHWSTTTTWTALLYSAFFPTNFFPDTGAKQCSKRELKPWPQVFSLSHRKYSLCIFIAVQNNYIQNLKIPTFYFQNSIRKTIMLISTAQNKFCFIPPHPRSWAISHHSGVLFTSHHHHPILPNCFLS